jgi:acetyl esterase/lipase
LSRSAAESDARVGMSKFSLPQSDRLSLADKNLGSNPDLHITTQTPPTFLLQAEDDHVDSVYDSLSYYIALKKAGIPAEMHLYAEGGHAFGLRRTKYPITGWPELVETWLQTIGMVSR